MLMVQGEKIDYTYLYKWASELGVAEELKVVRQHAADTGRANGLRNAPENGPRTDSSDRNGVQTT